MRCSSSTAARSLPSTAGTISLPTRTPIFDAPGRGEFSIGHLVDSRDQVDEVLAAAEAAGATLTEEPYDRPWGIYSGYFRDPDGHLWEVIWNPRHSPALA